MTAHAGEKAHKTGRFHCARCDAVVEVSQGDTIPECPNGHENYESRSDEPDTKG